MAWYEVILIYVGGVAVGVFYGKDRILGAMDYMNDEVQLENNRLTNNWKGILIASIIVLVAVGFNNRANAEETDDYVYLSCSCLVAGKITDNSSGMESIPCRLTPMSFIYSRKDDVAFLDDTVINGLSITRIEIIARDEFNLVELNRTTKALERARFLDDGVIAEDYTCRNVPDFERLN